MNVVSAGRGGSWAVTKLTGRKRANGKGNWGVGIDREVTLVVIDVSAR
jgi:hypothetical protein